MVKLCVFLVLSLLVTSVLLQQQVIVCPKNAAECKMNQNNEITVDRCTNGTIPVLVKKDVYTCEKNVDISDLNCLLTTKLYNQEDSKYVCDKCKEGYIFTINPQLDGIRLCVKASIESGIYIAIRSLQDNNNRIEACKNGYPSEDLTKCIMRPKTTNKSILQLELNQQIFPLE
jgi:hypothetical protein